jgi:hypothetical protein
MMATRPVQKRSCVLRAYVQCFKHFCITGRQRRRSWVLGSVVSGPINLAPLPIPRCAMLVVALINGARVLSCQGSLKLGWNCGL